MPLYEYCCWRGHVTELVRTSDERHDLGRCPVCLDYVSKVILHPPKVFGDYDGYESPASGKWIEGRRQRVEDLARTHCRPYEAGEREDMLRRQAQNDRRLDTAVDEAVERTLNAA